MKKGDIIAFISIVLISAVAAALLLFRGSGTTVTVKQDNKIVYEGSIRKDTTVELSSNTVTIKDGKVYMEWASCKNQICVHTGEISKTGESIICLPNRVIVETE